MYLCISLPSCLTDLIDFIYLHEDLYKTGFPMTFNKQTNMMLSLAPPTMFTTAKCEPDLSN